jgi:hypothetical protein
MVQGNDDSVLISVKPADPTSPVVMRRLAAFAKAMAARHRKPGEALA